MAYLALWWKIAGFTPVVTRTAMLMVSAFSLLGVFRLAQRIANFEVALASTACTAVYPVFFVQSPLAHVDLAAAGLIFCGLPAYVDRGTGAMILWFSLAVLAKETAILAPLALLVWEFCPWQLRDRGESLRLLPRPTEKLLLLTPLLMLGAWYGYHYLRTGYVFGNPEFFRYNVQGTLHPLRIALALLIRLWQTLGYLNLYFLTLAALLAMWRPPLHQQDGARPRIALGVQFAFLAVAIAYLLAMAVVGGAVLARYMLPVVPLVIVVCISTVWRRIRWWPVL